MMIQNDNATPNQAAPVNAPVAPGLEFGHVGGASLSSVVRRRSRDPMTTEHNKSVVRGFACDTCDEEGVN
jgi:hypothetical protein